MVQVGVDAEDLAEASADIVQERLGEAGALAEPVPSGEAGGGGVEGRGAGGDGAFGGGSPHAAGGVGCGGSCEGLFGV